MEGKIAIVGAGPSGCYVAQALLKARPGLSVDVIEALPVPFGLIRYGVATDHQGTKAVSRQFARLFIRQGARLIGNLRVGRDVTLAKLQAAYDAVVLATGLPEDLRLGIPGDDLPGIIGASALTRALYDHPEAAALPDPGPEPVIIGTGNVAIDLLRLLCKSPEELTGSDLGPGPTAWLADRHFRRITVIGRSPAAQAKCDPAMLRELAALSNARFQIQGIEGQASDELGSARLAALRMLGEAQPAEGAGIEVVLRFGTAPLAIEARGAALRLHLGSPASQSIDATSIITAIGFGSTGEALGPTDSTAPFYHAGWRSYGPVGTIARSRLEATPLAERILSDLSPDPAKPGAAIFAALPGLTDFAAWERIDAAETARAGADRCRIKFPTLTELTTAAKAAAPQKQELPS